MPDVDIEFERLKALGVEIVSPPTVRPWGAKNMSFLDPDKNLITFRSFHSKVERIINMSRQIRTSAKAVIIQNDKLLAIKLSDGKEEWYILPGGGQDCEEMLPQTVEREVREETGIEVKCKDLLFVIEGVHGESFHRIDLVFLCDYLGNAKNTISCNDTNQVGFDWLDLSVLNRLPLFPSKLRRPIMNFYEGKEYTKYLGNEETGDPECLE